MCQYMLENHGPPPVRRLDFYSLKHFRDSVSYLLESSENTILESGRGLHLPGRSPKFLFRKVSAGAHLFSNLNMINTSKMLLYIWRAKQYNNNKHKNNKDEDLIIPKKYKNSLPNKRRKLSGYYSDEDPAYDSYLFSYRCGCPAENHYEIYLDCPQCKGCNLRCNLQCGGLKMQSANIPEVTEMESREEENVIFSESTIGDSMHMSAPYTDLEAVDATDSASLGNYLARPVIIDTFTWNESDAIGIRRTLSPWHLFFNNAATKYRLNNFGFVRGNLKIKILVNASPFYYGKLRACYQPLPNFTPSTIVADTGTRYLIPYSQQPGVWITPAHQEGAEMTLPFFYHKNWLRIQKAQDFTDMGTLRYINYTALQSANGVTTSGVTIQTLAWMEDIVISGPSVGLAMQSSDEYGTGAVSAPASAVARAAGYFEKIPVIGKFATATKLGASAVSSIAKLFGWTNVPVIADHLPYRPTAVPPLASTDIGYPVEKLTIDSKNELSVDPSILGLPNEDELSVSHIATKESYLCTTTWSSSQLSDTLLFSSHVKPWLFDVDGSSDQIYMTPMAFASKLFQAWRGDIIFKFTFVASPYHKGRVRISYDPQGYSATSLLNTANTTNLVFTQYVELGSQSEVEIRIPYSQATSWLNNVTDPSTVGIPWSTSSSPTLTANGSNNFNGLITMRIVTALTGPLATTNVPILVSVRGAESLEFANPTGLDRSFNTNLSVWPLQSKDESECSEVIEHTLGDKNFDFVAQRYLTNYGECVKSFRPLMRRSVFTDVLNVANDASTSTAYLYKLTMSRFPAYYGYDPSGIHRAFGIDVPASAFSYNFVQTTPYNWLAPAFIGQRGSTHWTFNTDSPLPLGSIQAQRNPQSSIIPAFNSPGMVPSNRNQAAQFYFSQVGSQNGGAALTSQYTNAGLVVSAPNYSLFKFQSTNPANVTLPTNGDDNSDTDGAGRDLINVIISLNGANSAILPKYVKLWKYFGIGTDFNLYFFLNVPTMYTYGSIPSAP